MESSLFSNFDPDTEKNEDLKKHLGDFLRLSGQHRQACLRVLPEFTLAATPAETRALLDSVEQETGEGRVVLYHVLGMLDYFVGRMEDDRTRDDTSQAWGDDLKELGYLSVPEVPIFVQCMEAIRRDVLPVVSAERRRRRYAVGVLPSLTKLGATVELRAVQDQKYEWGTPIGDYRPHITDVVAVASIHLGVDAGAQRDFYFQLNERELQLMLDHLSAVKMDLASLRESVGRRSEESECSHDD